MATVAENLATAKAAYAAELALGNVKPSYSIDGQSVDWNAYRASLLDSIAKLETLIQQSEPYEEMSVGYSPDSYWP